MEILKIKLNEKQPIAQQLYLTEESDYGLAIQIDGLQSQGPESITFNGSQITSEKDKVTDYNLFKLKTPKYDKTQNKYLIEIPDADGSVTYKITVNIIQSETVYQDNGDNSSVELPEWTENIDGDADSLCIQKNNVNLYADGFCVATDGSEITVGQQYSQLSSAGGNSVRVDVSNGTSIYHAGIERFNINNTNSQIYSPNRKSDIYLNNNKAYINVNGQTILSSDDHYTSLTYDNGNTGIFLGQNNVQINYCGINGICMSLGSLQLANGCAAMTLAQDTIDIDASNEATINIGNFTVLSANDCGTILRKGNVYACMNTRDMELNAPCNIYLRSKETQLSSDSIELCSTNLNIYSNNIMLENGCTSVTNAQLSYLFQIAKKLTPENLPSVLEILGLNT